MASKQGIGGFFRRRMRKSTPERPSAAPSLSELFASSPSETPRPALPRFKATAADQVDRQHSDRFTSIRMRLRSAFTPSQPVVQRDMFAGRASVLNDVISSIEDQRLHLVIYGPRGIGKTSLLHMLAETAKEARYIVHYSSCGAASNFVETFRAAAADIPLLYHSGFGPTSEEAEAGASVADLLPKNGFSPRQFGEACAKLTGTRVLIILDEFDRSESLEFRREIAELIKILSDRSVRVQLVIAGVAGDIAELVEHIPSIRRNILAIRLPLMSDEETWDLVRLGEEASGLTYDDGARDLIVRVSGGWPYIASLIAHHGGLAAIDAGRTAVVADDVADAVQDALDEISGRIAKPVLVKVETLKREGMGKLLNILARAALTAGGEFEAEDIEKIAPTQADATGTKRLVTQLARDGSLIEERSTPTGTVYHFVEDGLPALLWFQNVREEFSGTAPKARASA